MTQSTQPISPLRQRMLSPKTQTGYVRAVKRLAGYLGRSPDSATAEDLRRFQLYLVDHGNSPFNVEDVAAAVAACLGYAASPGKRYELGGAEVRGYRESCDKCCDIVVAGACCYL